MSADGGREACYLKIEQRGGYPKRRGGCVKARRVSAGGWWLNSIVCILGAL